MYKRQLINVSLSHGCFSLSPFLSKINKHILQWGFKKNPSSKSPAATGRASLSRSSQRHSELCLGPGTRMQWLRKSEMYLASKAGYSLKGPFKPKSLCFYLCRHMDAKRNRTLEKFIPRYWKCQHCFTLVFVHQNVLRSESKGISSAVIVSLKLKCRIPSFSG